MSEFLSELPLHGKSSSRERGKGRKNRRSSKHSGVVDDPASRLRKHKHKHKAIDLMADMHNSIHQVRDDELTKMKKREKKLITTLEHAMEGMIRYKERARKICSIVMKLQMKNPVIQAFYQWRHASYALYHATTVLRKQSITAGLAQISMFLRRAMSQQKQRRFTKWRANCMMIRSKIEVSTMRFSHKFRRLRNILKRMLVKPKIRAFQKWKSHC